MIAKIVPFLLLSLLMTGCNKKSENQSQNNNANTEATKTVKQTDTTTNKTATQEPQKNVLHMKGVDQKDYELIADYRGLIFKGYEGKILLLDFFATWCPPCRAEIPHLVNLQKKYKGKLQVFSILMEENKSNEEMEDFIDSFDINYPVLNSKENFFLSQALGGIKSLPTLVIYDKTGAYFTHFVGAAPEEMLESAIEKALKK